MDNEPKPPTAAYDVLCRYNNPAPQCQANTPPEAVIFAQNNNTVSTKTIPGNNWI